MATYITSRYRLSVGIIHGTICVWEVILHLVRTQHCCNPLVQLLPLNMRHCREQKRMERTLSTFSKAHQWPECYVTLFFIWGAKWTAPERTVRQWKRWLFAGTAGKRAAVFCTPSAQLAFDLRCWPVDRVGGPASNNSLLSVWGTGLQKRAALSWMHLHNSCSLFPPSFSRAAYVRCEVEAGWRAAESRTGWVEGVRGVGAVGEGEGRCLAFPPLGVARRKCMIQPMTHTFKNVRPKIYLSVLFSTGWKADEVCFCTCVIFFVPLAKNVPIPPRSSQGDFFFFKGYR